MIKNITILDTKGNMIGTTYPKRAKGLVKSGRACFVDGKTVQLTCPPRYSIQKQQEDIIMDTMMETKLNPEQTFDMTTADIIKNAEQREESTQITSIKAAKLMEAGVSLKDILDNLNAICKDNVHIHKALDDLEKLPYTAPSSGTVPDLAGQARAEAISDIITCRETTNQMIIKLYVQIYTDYMEK